MKALEPGTYVVAVSGGVDSVVLLDKLVKQLDVQAEGRPRVRLVVAHFDHGIRTDSEMDRQLVQGLARQHGLPFVYEQAELGPGASEMLARDARYNFLHRVREAANARAIITAHHQDDVLETAVLNMLRGTNRKGLTSLQSHPTLHRPLLDETKAALVAYAKDQGLTWREDYTNQDVRYSRNYLRQNIMPKLRPADREKLIGHLSDLAAANKEIDSILDLIIHIQPSRHTLNRHIFNSLPYDVSVEVLAHWLRSHDIRDFDRTTLQRLVRLCKTLESGKIADVNADYRLRFGKDVLALVARDR